MKAVMDIGSNSVRLRVFDCGVIAFDEKITSRLAEGSKKTGLITEEAEKRTLSAAATLALRAGVVCGVETGSVMAFATAAVRNSLNGERFISELFERTGIKARVLSGEEEAEIGLLGALDGGDGTLLDVGGGSSELAVKIGGKVEYSYSLGYGAVNLYDECGEDYAKIRRFTDELVKSYGSIPKIKRLVAIGGTATSCAYALIGKKQYDPRRVQDFEVTRENLNRLLARLSVMTAPEREAVFAEAGRGKTIVCGASLLSSVLDYLGLDGYFAGEKGNLEGYCLYRTGSL